MTAVVTQQEEKYIPVADARDRLGVSKPKIAALIKAGILHTKASLIDGRSKLVPLSEVEALIKAESGTKRGRKPKQAIS